jgi:hypothetical protein
VSDTATLRLVAGPSTAADLQHVACCRNDDMALCGTDVTDAPWLDDETSCVVCVDLDEFDACPFGGSCPPEETE